MQHYAKAIVAAVGAVVSYLAVNCNSPEITALVGLLTAAGVLAVPNAKKLP